MDNSFEKFSLNFSNFSIAIHSHVFFLINESIFYFFFLGALPLFGVFTLEDHYFKFSFDLKAILYIGKHDFIHDNRASLIH